MSQPLGYLTYFRGNKGQVLKYMLCLILCMFILGTTRILLISQHKELLYCNLDYEFTTHVEFSSWNEEIENKMNQIQQLEEVEAVYPFYYTITNCNTLFASVDEKTYFVDEAYIKRVFDYMKMDTSKVKWPKQDSGGALMSTRVMKLKGYQLGDLVSGTLNTYCEATYSTNQCVNYVPTTVQGKNLSYLVIPALGKEKQLTEKLRILIGVEATIFDLEQSKSINQLMLQEVNENFNMIMMIITLMTATTAGVLTCLHYQTRSYEMVLLSTIGYSQKYIIKRMTKEIAISTSIAAGIACILLNVCCYLFNQVINEPNGYILFKVDYEIIVLIITISLFMMAFSSIPTWIMLSQHTYSID